MTRKPTGNPPGRPKKSGGRVTARIDAAIWTRLLMEPDMSGTINAALRAWYGVTP
jgi:hypothetical protein